HDEAAVIGETIGRVRALNYPAELVDIHVVADHCEDETALLAREAGAEAHERREGLRGSKGAALAWLYQRIRGREFEALVLLDADARVDGEFLTALNAALSQGNPVVQGRQIISNPEAGWYAALAYGMYEIEGLVHNQGRSALGGSSHHMGD